MLKDALVDFWFILGEMSPYLLFGFFVAGVLSVSISQRTVERHLGGRGIWPLLKASVFGIPLPLCSCGVIPVSMSLHKHGASKGATISFLISTPQTGVDSIFVTLSLLGPVFAVFRPFAALFTGIVGGSLVNVFCPNPEYRAQDSSGVDEQSSDNSKTGRLIRGANYGFVSLPADIGKAMLIGLIVAAGVSVLVPEGFFAEKLGTGIFAMVVMMFLGIPVYVCATASVPVAAALIMKGLTPGAAIVFLMTGPATNAASLVTIWKQMGMGAAIVYLTTVAGCALLSGIVLDYLALGADFNIVVSSARMLPAAVKNVSAVALLLLLGFAFFSSKRRTV